MFKDKVEIPKYGIAVDASTINGNPGDCEVQGIDLSTGEVVFCEKIGIATNNIAEYIAIAFAVQYLKENNLKKPIYSDSLICINWVKRDLGCKTNFFQKYPEKANQNIGLKLLIAECETLIYNTIIDLRFWNKKLIGKENPADFGRK